MTPNTPDKPFRPLHTAAFITVICVMGLMVYSNTFHTPFLFDDDGFIVNDYAIRMTEFSWDGIKRAALEGYPAHRYLPNISFAINYYIGVLDPFGYHVLNLAIHLLTSVFLFFLVKNTLRVYLNCRDGVHPCPKREGVKPSSTLHPEIIAFFTALIWIVQPVGTQAVTYICQRMASMVALFYVLSLLLYIKGRMAMAGGHSHTTRAGCIPAQNTDNHQGRFLIPVLYFAGSALAALCAIATKENAGTLPIIILLYEWFFFQDLKFKWSRNQIFWALFFLLIFGGAVIWYMGGNPMIRLMNSYNIRDFNMMERVLTQFRIVIYYISLFLYAPPGRLNLDHDYPLSMSHFSPPTTFVCMIAIFTLIALSGFIARKERIFSFCILWFFITQATESTIIGIELIFEHRTYIPFMMTSLMLVLVLFRVFHFVGTRFSPARKPGTTAKIYGVYALLCAIVLIFSFWTYQRNFDWQNPVTFWSDAAAKSPGKYRSQNDLGIALYDAGDIDGAIRKYKKAIEIAPDHTNVYNNMGNALFKKGLVEPAIHSFTKALGLDPKHIEARNNLANALMRQGKLDDAVRHFQIILDRQPDHVEANINMGAALARMGRIDDALGHYRTAIQSDPNNPEAFNNMGVLFTQKNMMDEAKKHFQKALELRPGYQSAINNLRRLDAIQP